MSENGMYQGNHLMKFTEKAWYEHIGDFCKHLSGESVAFFALAGTLWGFVYILVEVLDGKKTPIGAFVLPVIIIALIVVLYRAWLKCKTYTPEALQGESDIAKEIFRKQKCGWQFALAEQMLAEKIENIDATLKRIKKGAEFIEPASLAVEEYYDWLRLRPVALKRLVRAAMIQCTDEVPALLRDADNNETYLTKLKIRIAALVQLYEYTKRYEAECYQIVPQETIVGVHETTYGWTEPIQKGINEFMQILHALATMDRKQLKAGKAQPPIFNIVIAAPENVDEFCKRVDDLIIKDPD